MRLEILQLDEAFASQAGFLAACAERAATVVDAREEAGLIRLWGRENDMRHFADKLPRSEEPALTFFGSGDFHHISALLVERAASAAEQSFTVVHFDNHPDWVRQSLAYHCGSWVNLALRLPQVSKVVTVGVCSKDLQHPEWKGANLAALKEGALEIFAFEQAPSAVKGDYGVGPSFYQEGRHLHWNCIADMGIASFADVLPTRIHTDAVYITVDKDVVVLDEAVTNWDQGRLHLDELIRLIRSVAEHHEIIGVDVVGDYSPVHFAGGLWPYIRKWGETLIDHPRLRVGAEAIAARNEAANLKLLGTFSELMAQN